MPGFSVARQIHVQTQRFSPERVENGAKNSQNAFAFTQYRIEIVGKLHPNWSDLKTIPKRFEMKKTLEVLCEDKIQHFFVPRFAQPLLYLKTVTLTAFHVIFFALFERSEV